MRRSRGYVSGSVASDWLCAFVGALAALVVGLGTYGAILLAMPPALDDVEQNSLAVANTVAQSVGADIRSAVSLGIPIEEMRGVHDYLAEVLGFAPEVEEIAILDRQERLLFSSDPAPDSVLDGPHVRAPVLDPASETVIGTVIVHASTETGRAVARGVLVVSVLVALLSGLVVAVWLRIVRLERLDLPTVRTAATLRSAGRGHFIERGLTPSGLLTPLVDALARAVTPIQLTHRRIQTLADEIRAVDGSAAVRQRAAEATAAMQDLSLERRRGRMRTIGFVWWPAAALTVLMGTRPLVANFAYDRIGDDPYAAVSVALAVTAGAVGAILGVLVALAVGGRLSKPVTFAAMVASAVAFAAVYFVRDYRTFIALAAFANFTGWLAVWTVLQATGAGRRLPWRGGLILLAAAAIGPILGALLAEAEGRRAAFATLGALAAVLAVLSTTGAPRLRQATRPPALTGAEAMALAAVSLAVFAWIDVNLAGWVLRERYAMLGLNFGVCGVAAFVPYLTRVRVPAAAGAVLAAAAVLVGGGVVALPYLDLPGPDMRFLATSTLAGLGFGMVTYALGARAFVPSAAVAIGIGGIVAGAPQAAALVVPGAGFALSAIAAAALAGLAILATITRALGWYR
ncbi:hypothetical protein [Acuticoccus sp. I52.16.1]|uniref:hypothetical protein n=1 Tax=Acuticoccus sp. I52.16.1 TaxID=2928472 RepID=UPI001FD5D899|nr:hypothetical protein [Acuticoccus sp. I52.16.1]UOM32910.1 hypothetical protein MRB58_13605 [Acuticoccus sp. I52.16.1]